MHAYITASLAYQGTHSKHNTAFLEIVFNAGRRKMVPYYKLRDDEKELAILELKQILRDGQTKGEFRQFNVHVMASAISGAIGEYMFEANTNITTIGDL